MLSKQRAGKLTVSNLRLGNRVLSLLWLSRLAKNLLSIGRRIIRVPSIREPSTGGASIGVLNTGALTIGAPKIGGLSTRPSSHLLVRFGLALSLQSSRRPIS
jgi:hypothetical protein